MKITEIYPKIFRFWRWNFLYIWIDMFSKAVVRVLVLLFAALWFILRGFFLLIIALCYFNLVFFSPLASRRVRLF